MLLEKLQPEEPFLVGIIRQQIRKLEDVNDSIILDIMSEQTTFDGETHRFPHHGAVHDIWIKPASMHPPITSLGFQPCSHIVVIDYFRMGKNGELRDRATSLMRDLVLFDENNELYKNDEGRWVLTGHGR